MNKYYTISLPEKIVKIIDEKITQQMYTSRAEYLKELIRQDIRRNP